MGTVPGGSGARKRNLVPVIDEALVTSNDTARLLDDITALIRKYVIFVSEHEAHAIALLVLLTYARNADGTSIFFVSPYLYIRSRRAKCAKTRLIEILRELVAIPSEHYHRLTEAIIFRLIETERCILFIDEIHHLVNGPESDGIIGILNGGNFADGVTARCDPKNPHGVIKYSIAGIKIFAGRDVTGTLPDETVSRTIIIEMPHMPNASKILGRRFNIETYRKESAPISDRCSKWFSTYENKLRNASDPIYPDTLTDDRTAETWRGMLIVAALAGPQWFNYAQAALIYLASGETETTETENDGLSFDTAVKHAMTRGYIKVSGYEDKKLPPAIDNVNPTDWGWPGNKAFHSISLLHDKTTGKSTLRITKDDFERFWHTVKRANNGYGTLLSDMPSMLRDLRNNGRLTTSGRGFKTPAKIWESDSAKQQIICIDVTSWIDPPENDEKETD